MGVLIKIDGVNFDPEHIIGKVDIIPECPHEYDNACDPECNLCGFTREVTHDYDENGYCTICGLHDPNKPYTLAEYPVQATLQGLYDLGGADSVVNAALNPTVSPIGGTAKLDFSGGGSVSDDYATFTGQLNKSRLVTYLRLPMADKITAVMLFRVPVTGQSTLAGRERPLFSNRAGGTGIDSLGVTLTHKNVTFANSEGTTITETFDAIEDDNAFSVLALSIAPDGLQVYRYANGALNELVDYTEKDLNGWISGSSGNAVVFGGSGISEVVNSADISLASVHTGDVTEGELESICKFVKAYGEQKGLTIE